MNEVIIGHKSAASGLPDVVIEAQARRQHTYLVGKTGTGKSTLLKNMAVQDIRNGEGVAVIDPHGDLIEDIINYIPKSRIKQVVYLNPADIEYPVGLNILEVQQKQEKQLVASSLVSVFRHLFRDSWGVRTEYVLFNAVLALMDTRGSTLLDVYRLLIDPAFRDSVVNRVSDPIVKIFWREVFDNYDQRFASEVVSPIQNKVGQLLTGSYLRNIVGQPQSTFDLRHVIDNKQILLANLAKGRIGEDRANLLGSVLITKLYLAALERQDTPEDKRKDFYLYIDEFQNFSTDAFPSILSEARKYRLNLTLVHQYLDQIPEDIRLSVFGNVGTWIVFRVGTTDALLLEKEFAPYFDVEAMTRQENYEVIYKTLKGGKVLDPNFTKTPQPIKKQGSEAAREKIISVSRERYAKSRGVVEKKILQRLAETGQPALFV